MSFFNLKMVHNIVLYDSGETACLGKIWFFSYGLKCFQPIRLQYSLIYISLEVKKSIDLFDFLHRDNHQRKVGSETTTFGLCGKESLSLLEFLHGNNHQGKIASETTNFGQVWSVMPLFESDCRII